MSKGGDADGGALSSTQKWVIGLVVVGIIIAIVVYMLLPSELDKLLAYDCKPWKDDILKSGLPTQCSGQVWHNAGCTTYDAGVTRPTLGDRWHDASRNTAAYRYSLGADQSNCLGPDATGEPDHCGSFSEADADGNYPTFPDKEQALKCLNQIAHVKDRCVNPEPYPDVPSGVAHNYGALAAEAAKLRTSHSPQCFQVPGEAEMA